jgi:hypothetical protein
MTLGEAVLLALLVLLLTPLVVVGAAVLWLTGLLLYGMQSHG